MPTSDWSPSVGDVGALLRARTTDIAGNEVGTFNEHTRPTAVQVANIIAHSVSEMVVDTAEDLPSPLWGAAKRAVTLDAAMMVELTYYPEQVNQGNSPYEELKKLRDERWPKLVAAYVEGLAEGEESDQVGGSPSYAFPADAGGLVGWGTKW